jgi:soluble lytic murein transglycosylase
MRSIFFVVLSMLSVQIALGQTTDAALRRVTEADRLARTGDGLFPTLSAAEHLSRAETYSANRLFPEARAHWQKVIETYPSDPGISKALFGIARSFMWERKYDQAVDWFKKLTKDHIGTKDGREGLAFMGASYVRMGNNLDAAKTYEQYASKFPDGERIESSYLNIIDAYREAGRYDDANRWVEKAVQRFSGNPAEVNAVHARLRMEVHRENWTAAIAQADRMLSGMSFKGSMASADEVRYLRAIALERSGRRNEAAAAFNALRSSTSYFGGLARERRVSAGIESTGINRTALVRDYPAPYRPELVREARKNKIDPRFLLAIMKQESTFRANAKSPAGARGLLQLVFDTALKYAKKAGYPQLRPDDLYRPAVSVAVGSAYVGELAAEFDGLYEAIAASYNGGEDNAARWLSRAKPKDPGIFASEVGFAETKNYVFKVMNNYRAYRELYTEDLQLK